MSKMKLLHLVVSNLIVGGIVFSIIQVLDLILIVVVVFLLYKNRKLKYQRACRALFVVIICFFAYSLML